MYAARYASAVNVWYSPPDLFFMAVGAAVLFYGVWALAWPALLLLATMDYKQPRTDISCAVPS